jgi:hypothetical protein
MLGLYAGAGRNASKKMGKNGGHDTYFLFIISGSIWETGTVSPILSQGIMPPLLSDLVIAYPGYPA